MLAKVGLRFPGLAGLAESLELSEVYGMSMLSRVYTRWSVSRAVCCEQIDITEDETKDRGRLNENTRWPAWSACLD